MDKYDTNPAKLRLHLSLFAITFIAPFIFFACVRAWHLQHAALSNVFYLAASVSYFVCAYYASQLVEHYSKSDGQTNTQIVFGFLAVHICLSTLLL